MRKIKDMAEHELQRLVAQVVFAKTDLMERTMHQITERFKQIEDKLEQEVTYPNAYKKHIMEEIAKLNKDIDDFLGIAKELKRKEDK